MVRHVLASCVEQFEAASLWLWYRDRQLAADIERRDRRRLGWIITKGPRERGSQGPLARGNLLRRPIVQPRMSIDLTSFWRLSVGAHYKHT
jgi:hypothetical protein